MANLNDVRAVVFDLDDTLCGYWDAAKTGLWEAFATLPPGSPDPDTMMRHWAEAFRTFSREVKSDVWYGTYLRQAEPSRTEQMRRTLARVGIEDPALPRQIGDAYAAARDAALRLFPESIEVLQAMQGRRGLGMITNGPADVQRQEIATLGIEPYFDLILIEGEAGLGKPDPEIFRMAERHFGLSPREIAMVGNSYGHDILGAIEAGWRTVWIRRDSDVAPSAAGPEQRPADKPVPDAEIADLRELLLILGLQRG